MRAIATVAVIFSLFALGTDLYNWHLVANGNLPSPKLIQFSALLRFARTAVFALVIIPYRHKGSVTANHALMWVAMLIATLADYFLVLKGQLVIGVGIFALMQLVLLYRHLQGVSWQAPLIYPYNLATALMVAVVVPVLWGLQPGLSAKGMFMPVTVYAVLLGASVLATVYMRQSGRFSKSQCNLALAGMLCFMLCDITVGLGAVWLGQPRGYLIRALTGLAYTPALVLLCYSAYGHQTE